MRGRFPFLAPNVMVATSAIVASVCVIWFVPDTNPPTRQRDSAKSSRAQENNYVNGIFRKTTDALASRYSKVKTADATVQSKYDSGGVFKAATLPLHLTKATGYSAINEGGSDGADKLVHDPEHGLQARAGGGSGPVCPVKPAKIGDVENIWIILFSTMMFEVRTPAHFCPWGRIISDDAKR